MASVEFSEVSESASRSKPSSSNASVEIETLKERFGPDIRVIKSIGDFAYLLQISLKESGITIKFQLTDGYPSEPAELIIAGKSVPEVTIAELRCFLINANKTGLVTDFIDLSIRWLTEHNSYILSSASTPNEKKNQRKVKKTKSEKASNEDDSTKKTSMKTSEDVIKRIMWDSNLEADSFKVGYLDRFVGLVEQNFSTFCWEDLASVDYTVLAIPKHRIQYFKYKDLIVWDKTKRMDNVFGSTGSNTTITDVIENYVEQPTTTMPMDSSKNDDESDDDDDDEVIITVDSKNEVDEASDDENGEPWQNKLRPNYFLCQRITDPEVLESVDIMQSRILDVDSRYVDCCIRPSMLHLTLCTLGLPTQEHVRDVAEILERNREELAEMARSKITIKFSGVDNFYQRVVYGKVLHDENFKEFVEHLRALIREAGINICDNYEFVPHMTLLKVTRPAVRQVGSKKVPYWMYNDFKDMEFGSQTIDGIHLCAMKGERIPGKFYDSPAHISFMEVENVLSNNN